VPFVNRIKLIIKYFTILVTVIIISLSCSDQKKDTVTNKIKKINYDRFGFIADSFDVFKGTVKKNETLADILLNSNIEYNLITEIYNKTKPHFDFKKIQPEKIYKIYSTQDSLNQFKAFVYEIDKIKFLKVTLFDSLQTEIVERKVLVKQNSIVGKINSSLYETFSNLNAPIVLAGSLAEIFAWQIDFYTIQKEDEFLAIYEELYVGNEMIGIGDIIAAEFIHKSNPYYAFQFTQNEKKEFFDDEGKSLQKQFIKAPLKYNRISSHYSGSRLHPIFRVYRPHRGIDYTAAIGTPVQAVGDGIIVKAARDGGAGKMVKIKHNSFYSSAYLHLSGYGKEIKPGKKVSQGQVIGFVGSTGNSTGPHLDFRFWKNGSLVNYLNQKFPSSKSVADSNLSIYKSFSDSLKTKLDSLKAAAI
jgi:murein DD-endopeptidase MepM/ murein hydrolase activator NlpD